MHRPSYAAIAVASVFATLLGCKAPADEMPAPAHVVRPPDAPDLWRRVADDALFILETDAGAILIEAAPPGQAVFRSLADDGAFSAALGSQRGDAAELRSAFDPEGAIRGTAWSVNTADAAWTSSTPDRGYWRGFPVVVQDTKATLLSCAGAVALRGEGGAAVLSIRLEPDAGQSTLAPSGLVIHGARFAETLAAGEVARGFVSAATLEEDRRPAVYVMRTDSPAFRDSLAQARVTLGATFDACSILPPAWIDHRSGR